MEKGNLAPKPVKEKDRSVSKLRRPTLTVPKCLPIAVDKLSLGCLGGWFISGRSPLGLKGGAGAGQDNENNR